MEATQACMKLKLVFLDCSEVCVFLYWLNFWILFTFLFIWIQGLWTPHFELWSLVVTCKWLDNNNLVSWTLNPCFLWQLSLCPAINHQYVELRNVVQHQPKGFIWFTNNWIGCTTIKETVKIQLLIFELVWIMTFNWSRIVWLDVIRSKHTSLTSMILID